MSVGELVRVQVGRERKQRTRKVASAEKFRGSVWAAVASHADVTEREWGRSCLRGLERRTTAW